MDRKLKKKLALAFFGVLTVAVSTMVVMGEKENYRLPTSIPNAYESLSACEKQDVLWKKVQESTYKELPDYKKMGLVQLVRMGMQEIKLKGDLHSDFAPEGWVKHLHRRGAMAKVKIVPLQSQYTGIFQGADCGFLRLSLTYKVAGSRPVAPGLALKVLRDGTSSANISALVSLEGQGKDFNFFKYPMSNIVPMSSQFGQKLVHGIFGKVTSYPEELVVSDMSAVGSHGEKIANAVYPRQLFFVPSKDLEKFSSDEHDVRDDFAKIQEGSVVYHVYALTKKHVNFNYANYNSEMAKDFLKDSEHIADIVSTSEFLASEFGDDGIFFRHQLRPLK